MDEASSGAQQGLPFDRVSEVACPQCKQTIDVSGGEPFSSLPCPHCGQTTAVPATLGDYVLVGRLGPGGMGSVFRGFDRVLKRTVALKVMQGAYARDPEFVRQFLHEARALAALNHPNIVQVFTCGEAHGQPYMVMEFVPEGNLEDLIENQGGLNETFVLDTAIGVTQGLAAAAEIGLAHGDVKPQNILFDKQGHVKVADFGLARFRGEQPRQGEIWGSPYYIAPEVARGSRPDVRSDIYSLGVTLFRALTGEAPFQGKTVLDTVVARLEKPPPDLRTIRTDLHPATADAVMRMLAADRMVRYPNYTSVLEDLRAARQAIAPEKKVAPPPPTRRTYRGHLSGILFAAILALALIAVFLKIGRQKRVSPPPAPRALPPGFTLKTSQAPRPTPAATPAAPAPAPRAPRAKPATVAPPQPAMPPPPAPVIRPDASGVVRISTAIGRGADASVQGHDSSKGRPVPNSGSEPLLVVRAGKDASLAVARKAYLRFDLSGVERAKIASASVELTVAERSSNVSGDSYELLLWGVFEEGGSDGWFEGGDRPNPDLTPDIVWLKAPGNDPASASQMLPGKAVLISRTLVAGNPATGTVIMFHDMPPRSIAEFLRKDTDLRVTLAVTATEDRAQRTGWKFASRENPTFSPPVLVLRLSVPGSGRP